MKIIPVIDLKDGQVVHAVRGDRNHYRPIHLNSCLTQSSNIDAVLTGFLQLHPFDTFYIADLNAILGDGNHDKFVDTLLYKYPDIDFWIDNGAQVSDIDIRRSGNCQTVIGTESQHSLPSGLSGNFILSLDFKHQQPAGDQTWFSDSVLWPRDVIVMTLARVGSNAGPDFQKLRELRTTYPDKNFIAAGGIRHGGDLLKLDAMGIGAALLATSLHTGALSREEIANLQAKKYPGKPRYFSQP
ncbi:MAG: HisA/HisF-related TIM barrel protein [Methylomonas sp.]